MDGSSVDDAFHFSKQEGMDTKAKCHLHGLGSPQATLNGNILRLTINPNQPNLYMGRISQNMYIYEDLPHKEKSSWPRNKGWFYTNIKTKNPQKAKVRIIYPVLAL